MRGLWCCWIAPAAFLFDRLTKLWARARLAGKAAVPVIPGALRLVYVENTGAAFGLLRGRQPLLLVFTGLAILLLCGWLYAKRRTATALLKGALCLLIGGALGNFVDRLAYGAVVDFIEITLFSFPIFNVADICVCVACLLLAYCIFFGKEERPDGG